MAEVDVSNALKRAAASPTPACAAAVAACSGQRHGGMLAMSNVVHSLLALDLGMSCGWAVFGPTGELESSGTWKLGKDKTRGRYGELLLRLQTAVGMNGIGAIAYEHVHHHTGIDAGHVYGGWLAVLDMLTHGTRVGLIPITTSEIHAFAKVSRARSPKIEGQTMAEKRKAAAARRVLNKAATLQAAHDRGWPVADDNEAEACFCAAAALRKARTT